MKEVESGKLVKETCREYGISDATYYTTGKQNKMTGKPLI